MRNLTSAPSIRMLSSSLTMAVIVAVSDPLVPMLGWLEISCRDDTTGPSSGAGVSAPESGVDPVPPPVFSSGGLSPGNPEREDPPSSPPQAAKNTASDNADARARNFPDIFISPVFVTAKAFSLRIPCTRTATSGVVTEFFYSLLKIIAQSVKRQ